MFYFRNEKDLNLKGNKRFDTLKIADLQQMLFEYKERMLDLQRILREIEKKNDSFSDIKAFPIDNSNDFNLLRDIIHEKIKLCYCKPIVFPCSEFQKCCTYKNEIENSFLISTLNNLLPKIYSNENPKSTEKRRLCCEKEKLQLIVRAFKKVLEIYFILKYELLKYSSAEILKVSDYFSCTKSLHQKLLLQLYELSKNLTNNLKLNIKKDAPFSSINLLKTNKECKTEAVCSHVNFRTVSTQATFLCANQTKKDSKFLNDVQKKNENGNVEQYFDSNKKNIEIPVLCFSKIENSTINSVEIDIGKLKEAIKEHSKFIKQNKNNINKSSKREDYTNISQQKTSKFGREYLKQQIKNHKTKINQINDYKRQDYSLNNHGTLSTRKNYSIYLNKFHKKSRGRNNITKNVKHNEIIEEKILSIDRSKIKASLKARKQQLKNKMI